MSEDFIRVPADSAGKRVHNSKFNDGVNVLFNQVLLLGDRNDPTLQQAVDNKGAAFVRFADGSAEFDVYGRTTVSEPNLMGMYKLFHRDYLEELEKNEVGAGVVARDGVVRSLKLACGTASGDKAEVHSHRHYHYRPGNSMTLVWTMKMGDAGKAGVTRWAGWRTADDGIYFELVDTVFYAVVKNGNAGTEERIPVASWNGDRLNGAGGDNNLSEATIDLTKNNIWWIDFQFLGAGAVRFGTYVNGDKITCHTIGHYNTLDKSYLSSAAMSLAYGQENTGVSGSSSEMHIFCVVVTNDGYDEFDRRPVSVSTEKTITTTTFVPIMSFRPTALFHGVDNRARILPQMVSVLAEGGAIEIIAEANTTLTGDAWASSVSGTELDIAATVTTGGERKIGSFVSNGRSESIDLSSVFKLSVDGVTRHYTPTTSDHITISARLLTAGSATAAVSLNVIEIE